MNRLPLKRTACLANSNDIQKIHVTPTGKSWNIEYDASVTGDRMWATPVSYTHLTLPTIYSV